MTVLGLGFNKIVLEKTGVFKGKSVKIKNNASLNQVDKININLGDKNQAAVRVLFEFKADYEPKLAYILLKGETVWVDNTKKIDALMKEWKKNKKLPSEEMSQILNVVLSRSNVEALVLSRELNLPPPVPLPKVKVQ